MRPLETPPEPLMYEPLARMLVAERPMPPADLEIWAHSLSVSKMPSIESSFIARRKHDDICGCGVPALNIVGVAWVNHFSDIRWYVSIARSMSCMWMPSDTRISICCGRSTILLCILSRYDFSSVLKPKKSYSKSRS